MFVGMEIALHVGYSCGFIATLGFNNGDAKQQVRNLYSTGTRVALGEGRASRLRRVTIHDLGNISRLLETTSDFVSV